MSSVRSCIKSGGGEVKVRSDYGKETTMATQNTATKQGQVLETTFFSNPKRESPFRFRATHIDGKRAPKVILCNDSRIQPGQLCKVRIISVKKPSAKERGFIEVEFLSQITFQFFVILMNS